MSLADRLAVSPLEELTMARFASRPGWGLDTVKSKVRKGPHAIRVGRWWGGLGFPRAGTSPRGEEVCGRGRGVRGRGLLANFVFDRICLW